MAQLSQAVRDIQREAADLPTDSLRATIQASLELLSEYIDQLQNIGLGAASSGETTGAANDVLYTALFAALHVQELVTRPAPRFARVRLSIN